MTSIDHHLPQSTPLRMMVWVTIIAAMTAVEGCASSKGVRSSQTGASDVLTTLGRSPLTTASRPTLRHVLSLPGGCVDPAFDPATGGIVVTADGGGGTTMLVHRGGHIDTTLPTTIKTPGNDQAAAISRDGRRIAYCSEQDGTVDLMVVDRTTGTVEVTWARSNSTTAPSWSPDGHTLAVGHVTSDDLRHRISIIDADSRTPPRFVDFGSHPCWSPDVTAPAMIYTKVGQGGFKELWHATFATDGSVTRSRILRAQGADVIDPTWAPDGLAVAFSVNGGASVPNASLWTMALPQASPRRIEVPVSSATQPTWGDDGWIYFTASVSGPPEIWAARSSLSTPQPPLAMHPPTPTDEHSGVMPLRADGEQAGGVREPGRMP